MLLYQKNTARLVQSNNFIFRGRHDLNYISTSIGWFLKQDICNRDQLFSYRLGTVISCLKRFVGVSELEHKQFFLENKQKAYTLY